MGMLPQNKTMLDLDFEKNVHFGVPLFMETSITVADSTFLFPWGDDLFSEKIDLRHLFPEEGRQVPVMPRHGMNLWTVHNLVHVCSLHQK